MLSIDIHPTEVDQVFSLFSVDQWKMWISLSEVWRRFRFQVELWAQLSLVLSQISSQEFEREIDFGTKEIFRSNLSLKVMQVKFYANVYSIFRKFTVKF